jgi:hypothetical protein
VRAQVGFVISHDSSPRASSSSRSRFFTVISTFNAPRVSSNGSIVRFAAPNPAGTGQPGAECGPGGSPVEPAGFLTGGFENAEAHYAGSDGTPSLANGSLHAVSQYDVACYQLSN